MSPNLVHHCGDTESDGSENDEKDDDDDCDNVVSLHDGESNFAPTLSNLGVGKIGEPCKIELNREAGRLE